jgi:hypothetical protein
VVGVIDGGFGIPDPPVVLAGVVTSKIVDVFTFLYTKAM